MVDDEEPPPPSTPASLSDSWLARQKWRPIILTAVAFSGGMAWSVDRWETPEPGMRKLAGLLAVFFASGLGLVACAAALKGLGLVFGEDKPREIRFTYKSALGGPMTAEVRARWFGGTLGAMAQEAQEFASRDVRVSASDWQGWRAEVDAEILANLKGRYAKDVIAYLDGHVDAAKNGDYRACFRLGGSTLEWAAKSMTRWWLRTPRAPKE